MTSCATRVALAASLALAACGPIPGGSLSGHVEPSPPGWKSVLEDGLYSQSHRWALAPWWPVESWAAIWIEHPEVKVRIGDAIYPLTAVQVTDPEQRTAILKLRGYDPPPEGIVVFRFDPRS